MPLQSIDERQKKIRSITLWGVLLNVFLMALKLVSGVLIRSSALIADGVHSLSDLATDFVVLIGIRLSSRPADKTHPYGHGKLDTIASILIALVLGSSQALSRSLFSQMIPHNRESAYFGLYEISERGTSWIGPVVFGVAVQITGSARVAMLPVILFFAFGIIVLYLTDVRRAIHEAGNEVPAVV